jgi:hypothetical protein
MEEEYVTHGGDEKYEDKSKYKGIFLISRLVGW